MSPEESLAFKTAVIAKFYDHLSALDAYIQTKDQEANIFLSKTALNDAVDEIVRDVEIMRHRRGSINPQTRGKIAGIIVFRLSRWNILSTQSPLLLEDRVFLKFNYLLALSVGLAYIQMPYSKLHEYSRTELLYSMSRRHVNQETLGLVLDIISQHVAN